MSNNSSNRIPVIAGNWKMHKTIEEAVSFVRELIPLIQNAQAKVYIAVPYTALRFAADAAKDSPIVIGAENMICRQWVKKKWGEKTAQKVIIQYGGSVYPNDAKDFMVLPDVDGVLLGGASLIVESFNKIIHYSSVED